MDNVDLQLLQHIAFCTLALCIFQNIDADGSGGQENRWTRMSNETQNVPEVVMVVVAMFSSSPVQVPLLNEWIVVHCPEADLMDFSV